MSLKKSILLVDDEVEIVNFLANFLGRLGINTIKATSGEEALKLYDKDKIDFVFLDIQMQGIDGLTVLRRIKEVNPRARVIMITGKVDIVSQTKAKKGGALDYITKPLDLGELKEKVEKYIL